MPVRRRKTRNGSGAILLLVLLLPVALLILQTTVLFLIGLVPTMVAAVVDRDEEKYAAITVGALNVAGVTYHALDLWTVEHSWRHLIDILADPFSWLTMYGGAAAGWAIYFVVPPLVAELMVFRAGMRIDGLKAGQDALVAEWGVEVTHPEASSDPVAATRTIQG